MITAVDTSVLLDVFAAHSPHLAASQRALKQAIGEGALVIGEVVITELRPWFSKRTDLNESLERLGIAYVPITRDASMLAGEAWKRYRAAGGPREHLIPDFLVAAHAQDSADRLLTRGRGFYRKWFKKLKILRPKSSRRDKSV